MAQPRPFTPRGPCPNDTCVRCYEAGRTGPATKTHFATNCPLFPTPRSMRVLLVPGPDQLLQQQGAVTVQEVTIPENVLQQYSDPNQYGYDYEQTAELDAFELTSQADTNVNYGNKDSYNYSLFPQSCDSTGVQQLEETYTTPSPTVSAVKTRCIQQFTALHDGKQAVLSIDSGCEGACMVEQESKRLGTKVLPLDSDDVIPRQADGVTPLDTVGKTSCYFSRNGIQLHFEGYVVKSLAKPILCGLPFIEENNIVQFPADRKLTIKNKMIMEDPPLSPTPTLPFSVQSTDSSCTTDEIPLHLIEVGSAVSQEVRQQLKVVHEQHKAVFDGNLDGGYNGASGDFQVDFDWINGIPPPPHKGAVPSYCKHADLQVLQEKINQLEKEGIVRKCSDLGINLKYASPCMLRRKPSSRHIHENDYNNLAVSEKSRCNRFILCLNKLCNFIQKKPASMKKIEDTINLVGSFKHVITSDLQDSFNQRTICQSKLPYMGFHSPFGDDYIFTRSPQGMINQSEELEKLVTVILSEGVAEGWVRVQADNIYVGGDTEKEAVQRWEWVLEQLNNNNIKLSAKKTSCFPDRLDLMGWIKEGDYLIPSPHRQNTLLTTVLPSTFGDLRSYLGTWHTLYKCKKGQHTILSPLTKMLSPNPKSGQKISWTKEQEAAFYRSREEAKILDKLYVPTTDDQLVITSDYAEKGTNMTAGISATLWAKVKDDYRVVARMSAELTPTQHDLLPCDGEVTAHYVAAKSTYFSVPIKASRKKTLALCDNKPVVEGQLTSSCEANFPPRRSSMKHSRLLRTLTSSFTIYRAVWPRTAQMTWPAGHRACVQIQPSVRYIPSSRTAQLSSQHQTSEQESVGQSSAISMLAMLTPYSRTFSAQNQTAI